MAVRVAPLTALVSSPCCCSSRCASVSDDCKRTVAQSVPDGSRMAALSPSPTAHSPKGHLDVCSCCSTCMRCHMNRHAWRTATGQQGRRAWHLPPSYLELRLRLAEGGPRHVPHRVHRRLHVRGHCIRGALHVRADLVQRLQSAGSRLCTSCTRQVAVLNRGCRQGARCGGKGG